MWRNISVLYCDLYKNDYITLILYRIWVLLLSPSCQYQKKPYITLGTGSSISLPRCEAWAPCVSGRPYPLLYLSEVAETTARSNAQTVLERTDCAQTRSLSSRVHNILSPLRHDRKPLIFQWAFTLRNAGIGSGSNPAFYTLKNEWLPVVTKRRQYIMNPPSGWCAFERVL